MTTTKVGPYAHSRLRPRDKGVARESGHHQGVVLDSRVVKGQHTIAVQSTGKQLQRGYARQLDRSHRCTVVRKHYVSGARECLDRDMGVICRRNGVGDGGAASLDTIESTAKLMLGSNVGNCKVCRRGSEPNRYLPWVGRAKHASNCITNNNRKDASKWQLVDRKHT